MASTKERPTLKSRSRLAEASAPRGPASRHAHRSRTSSKTKAPLDPKAKARQKKRRDKEIGRLLGALLGPVLLDMRSQWPQIFPTDLSLIRPFANDMYERLVKELPYHRRTSVRVCLEAMFCATDEYLAALAAGGSRYDLDGQPSGSVTPGEMAKAADELRKRRAKMERAQKAEGKSRSRKVRTKSGK